MSKIPYIEGTGKLATLYVDGKPFHARTGELNNSSGSSLNFMEKNVWPYLRDKHMNSVIVATYWECVEPEPGVFNFDLIDGLLAQARRENMKLIFLWFGLWKNGESTYVPEWVKLDPEKYWYIEANNKVLYTRLGSLLGDYRETRTISPLCKEAVAGDSRAFAAMMKHLKEVDEERTVIAIQVENEMGVLGSARDYSPEANEAFEAAVPEKLAKAMNVSGNWKEAFGEDAEEFFMAWNYALAAEEIASAGKAEYPLPMYVNAWLDRAPWKPGIYPSGGPYMKNYPIWKVGAPSIDALAPDNYAENYTEVCDQFESFGNPLFIPETGATAPRYLYAVGQHNVMCFSPFGIDRQVRALATIPESSMNIPANARYSGAKLLFEAYGIVEQMEDVIEKAHRENKIHGFMECGMDTEVIKLSHVDLHFKYGAAAGALRPGMTDGGPGAVGGGIVIELGDYEFLVIGMNARFEWLAKEEDGVKLGLLRKEDGAYVNNVWVRDRILNGDEQYHQRFGNELTCIRYKLYPYKQKYSER